MRRKSIILASVGIAAAALIGSAGYAIGPRQRPAGGHRGPARVRMRPPGRGPEAPGRSPHAGRRSPRAPQRGQGHRRAERQHQGRRAHHEADRPGHGPSDQDHRTPAEGEGRCGRRELTMPGPEQAIVVVEDDPSIADLLDLYLRDAGYRVAAGGDRRAGLELVRAHRPVLVILDIGLPGIDGFEVCRRLRADGAAADPLAHRPRRRDRPGARPRARCRRLRHQAVLAAGAGGPGAGDPAPRRGAGPTGRA